MLANSLTNHSEVTLLDTDIHQLLVFSSMHDNSIALMCLSYLTVCQVM